MIKKCGKRMLIFVILCLFTPVQMIKVLEEHVCDLGCDCGWNIKIGGTDKKDLKKLKKFLKELSKESNE